MAVLLSVGALGIRLWGAHLFLSAANHFTDYTYSAKEIKTLGFMEFEYTDLTVAFGAGKLPSRQALEIESVDIRCTLGVKPLRAYLDVTLDQIRISLESVQANKTLWPVQLKGLVSDQDEPIHFESGQVNLTRHWDSTLVDLSLRKNHRPFFTAQWKQ